MRSDQPRKQEFFSNVRRTQCLARYYTLSHSTTCEQAVLTHLEGKSPENAPDLSSQYITHSVNIYFSLHSPTRSPSLQCETKQFWHTFKANPMEISQIGFLKYIHAVSATLCRCQTLAQSTLWTPSKQIPWQRLGGSYFSNRKMKLSRRAFNSQLTIIFWHN